MSLLAYTTVPRAEGSMLLWAILDCWLSYRVWRGGSTALAWLRGLQIFSLVVYGCVALLEVLGTNFGTDATIWTALLVAVSLWCFMAPAITRHVSDNPTASGSSGSQQTASAPN